jgi:hypothetical protein
MNAETEKKWLAENTWNSNERITFQGMMVKRDHFQDAIQFTAKIATVDRNKLNLVTEECLQLIEYIGNKIEKVEVIKYKGKEDKEE